MMTAPLEAKARARRLPAEERKRQILDAAVRVFARLGFTGTGTADIAREAGIGEPTIYRYYANKRDLYLAAIRRVSDSIREHWQQIADEEADALAALRRIGIWYFQELSERPELLALRSRSFMELHDEEVAAVVREDYRSLVMFARGLFERAQSDGQLGPDVDIDSTTWMFVAVGALLDQTQMLGVRDLLPPEQVIKLALMIQPIGQ